MRQGAWKLIAARAKGVRTFELYNIEKDPYETRDLVTGEPEMVARLQQRMQEQSRLDRLPAP